jgi:tetratricopeptide (TPR) repeat protein
MKKSLSISAVMTIFVLLIFSIVCSKQKTTSSKAKEYQSQGEKLMEQFKLDQARASFKKAIEEDMNFTQAHRSYIDVSLQMGEEFRDELQKEYEAYLKAQPENPVIYYALGRIYADDKDQEKAFQKAIELDPYYPWGHFGMAYIHYIQKEFEKAIDRYEKAIELEPDEEIFYTSLAGLLRNRNPERYKQVQEIIQEKFPESSYVALMAYTNASRIKEESEKMAALEDYIKSYPNGPNASIALKRILDFHKKSNPEKAEKIAREALARPMTGTDKRFHRMAYTFLFQHSLDSVDEGALEKITNEIIESKNTDPSLYFQIGSQLQKDKQFELAEKFYLKAIEMISPENVYGTMAHGRFPEKELVDYCNEVFNLYSKDLGKLYLEMNEFENALGRLDQISFKDPDPEHHFLLAKAHIKIGNKEKAYESLVESLCLEPNDSARKMLIQVSEQLNKEENITEKIWKKRLERAEPAADFKLPDLEGNIVSLTDYRGKVVLINFWFPACGPCLMELPHIQKIYDKYKDRELEVLLIQVSQTKEEGKKFLEKNKYTMTSLYSDGTWAIENYGVKACPTNFFIDRQGRIIFKSTGYTPGDEKKIESQIKELLEFFDDQ